MIRSGLTGVDFVVINTDSQALNRSKTERKVQIGRGITKGLGTGANPALGEQAALEEYLSDLGKLCHTAERDVHTLAQANDALIREAKATTRRKNPFEMTKEGDENPLSNLRHSIDGNNFVRVIFDVVSIILDGFHGLQEAAKGFRSMPLILPAQRRFSPGSAPCRSISGSRISCLQTPADGRC